MGAQSSLVIGSLVLATYFPSCQVPDVTPTKPAADTPIAEMWERPDDLATRDLFYGPWGREHAPAHDAVYTFVKSKRTGMNPGMTVRDPEGRTWSVKQASFNDREPEGPIEVVVSRVLSAVGYHQPPVYLLPSFTLADRYGRRIEPGGRFRLDVVGVHNDGEWSWQQNPFVGTRPYQGLLVILLLMNSSDLKNENNTLYRLQAPDGSSRHWFVVRDLGIALGDTGRVSPRRGDIDRFERTRFITGTANGYVTFGYRGYHQELVRGRLTPEDVRWACELLAGLNGDQWRDAFRAGFFEPAVADRFIHVLTERIAEGLNVGGRAEGEAQ